MQQSRIKVFLKQIWPYVYRILNSIFYFILGIIRYFFRNAIKMIKGENRPVVSQQNRADILLALRFVDFIVIFEESTPEVVIKRLKPDVLVKGSDWQEDQIVGADFVKSYGGNVVNVKLLEGYSTSNLIDRIKKL